MTTTIRIGFVPEHFSTPLYVAQDKGFFESAGVKVEFHLCPGGTGEMTAMLKNKSIDLAIALTEGLVAGIGKGEDFYKIIGTYVESSLCWAISAGRNSEHKSIDTLENSKCAISRYGSGSHIIAYVLAQQREWLKEDKVPFEFSVENNFKSMRDAVNDQDQPSDYFMWETFTTKPYHDSGEIKRIGQITPPWPAFMFAAHTDMLAEHQEDLIKVLEAIQRGTKEFVEQDRKKSIELVKEKFSGYSEQDVEQWFKIVSYPKDMKDVSDEVINVTQSTLLKARVVNEEKGIEDYVVHLIPETKRD